MTQGKKADAGKAPINLIPVDFTLGIAQVFAFGGRKYGLHNFRLGIQHSRCLDAAFRHLLAILNGEELDPESGLPHIYHAGCSLAMYDYQRLKHPELNDVYELKKKEQDVCEMQLPLPLEIGEMTKLKDYEPLYSNNKQQSK